MVLLSLAADPEAVASNIQQLLPGISDDGSVAFGRDVPMEPLRSSNTYDGGQSGSPTCALWMRLTQRCSPGTRKAGHDARVCKDAAKSLAGMWSTAATRAQAAVLLGCGCW